MVQAIVATPVVAIATANVGQRVEVARPIGAAVEMAAEIPSLINASV